MPRIRHRFAGRIAAFPHCRPDYCPDDRACRPFRLKLQRNRFGMLVRSILSQQNFDERRPGDSLAAGATGGARRELRPASIAGLTPQQLRTVGLSVRKIEYVQDLARKSLAGKLQLERMGRLDR